MENKKWNPNDWQGKRKDQVDYANAVTFISIIFGIVLGIVVCFLYFCNVL